MYKKTISLTILLLLVAMLPGCIDRDLCYYSTHPHTGLIKPVFNWKGLEWSTTEIPTDNMSFLFVGDAGRFSYDTLGVYRLLTGGYSLIAYNESANASIRSEGGIDQMEAYTEVLGGLTKEPGVIFRDVASCTVTPDDTIQVDLKPVAVVKGINLTLHVEGLDDPAHIVSVGCLLGGSATAVNLSTGERNKTAATIPFSLKRATGGETTFTARITTFGPVMREGNTLTLDLNLYTGGTVTFPLNLDEYWQKAEADKIDIINCTLTIRIKKLDINTGDTEGDIIIDNWTPGTWDTLL